MPIGDLAVIVRIGASNQMPPTASAADVGGCGERMFKELDPPKIRSCDNGSANVPRIGAACATYCLDCVVSNCILTEFYPVSFNSGIC